MALDEPADRPLRLISGDTSVAAVYDKVARDGERRGLTGLTLPRLDLVRFGVASNLWYLIASNEHAGLRTRSGYVFPQRDRYTGMGVGETRQALVGLRAARRSPEPLAASCSPGG